MRHLLYTLMLCIPLCGCFKDDENLNTKSNLLDKDYEGRDPFAIQDAEYYTFTTEQGGVITYHYRVKFLITVDISDLPPNANEDISCTDINELIPLSTTATGNKRYQAIKIVEPGGGTYCFDLSFKDNLGYLGHKFKHCITAIG
jgi:hypothetical protein